MKTMLTAKMIFFWFGHLIKRSAASEKFTSLREEKPEKRKNKILSNTKKKPKETKLKIRKSSVHCMEKFFSFFSLQINNPTSISSQ